jgi:hypothetical protein
MSSVITVVFAIVVVGLGIGLALVIFPVVVVVAVGVNVVLTKQNATQLDGVVLRAKTWCVEGNNVARKLKRRDTRPCAANETNCD